MYFSVIKLSKIPHPFFFFCFHARHLARMSQRWNPEQLLFFLYINAATWWYIAGSPCVGSKKTTLCKSAKASSEDQIQAPNHLTPHFHFLIGTLTSCKEIGKVTIIKISASLNVRTRAHRHTRAASLFSFAHASISEAVLGQVNAIICHANGWHEARVPIGCDVFISRNGNSQLAVPLPSPAPCCMDTCQAAVPCGSFQTGMQTVWTAAPPPLVQKRRNQFATAEVTWHAFLRTDNRPARCSCLILSHFFFFLFFFFSHHCCFLNSQRISRFDGKKKSRSEAILSGANGFHGEHSVLSLAPARWAAFMQIATPCNFNASAKIEFVILPLTHRPWVCEAIGPSGRGLKGNHTLYS